MSHETRRMVLEKVAAARSVDFVRVVKAELMPKEAFASLIPKVINVARTGVAAARAGGTKAAEFGKPVLAKTWAKAKNAAGTVVNWMNKPYKAVGGKWGAGLTAGFAGMTLKGGADDAAVAANKITSGFTP